MENVIFTTFLSADPAERLAAPVAELSLIPDVDLAPYAVMLLEIERVAGTNPCDLGNGTLCDDDDPCTMTSACQDGVCVGVGDACDLCTSPSTIGTARLNLRKLQAPSGDDQLKIGGTVAVTTSPPIDPVAHGLRLVLTTNAGVGLVDLTAPAGSKWSANRAGTKWKYRDPSASNGIVNAKVQAIKPAGTLRVKVKARGLALGAAPAGTPPVGRSRSGRRWRRRDSAASRRSRRAGRRRTARRCGVREGVLPPSVKRRGTGALRRLLGGCPEEGR